MTLEELIKKYKDIRDEIDNPIAWRFGPKSVKSDLLVIDTFIKDLREMKGGEK